MLCFFLWICTRIIGRLFLIKTLWLDYRWIFFFVLVLVFSVNLYSSRYIDVLDFCVIFFFVLFLFFGFSLQRIKILDKLLYQKICVPSLDLFILEINRKNLKLFNWNFFFFLDIMRKNMKKKIQDISNNRINCFELLVIEHPGTVNRREYMT